jgi:hypothetical protein
MPPRLKLREEAQTDLGDVYALINATVPRMVQPVAMPASDMPRLVYRQDGQLMAYIAYSAGKRGVYVIPYLHPEVLPDAAAILDAALQMIAPATHLPVSVVIRRYQDWLGDALARLGFAPHTEQALMVKHLTAGVRTSSFATLHERLDGVRAKPHTQSYGSLSRAR